MDIIFYKSTNEVNSFPKSLTDGVTISGTLRSECDILNPVIEFTGIGVDIPYNYCYIPTFKRYYFITEARSIRNDILEISMHVDVLQSWEREILELHGIVDRCSPTHDDNGYINPISTEIYDDRYITLPTSKFYIIKGFYTMEQTLHGLDNELESIKYSRTTSNVFDTQPTILINTFSHFNNITKGTIESPKIEVNTSSKVYSGVGKCFNPMPITSVFTSLLYYLPFTPVIKDYLINHLYDFIQNILFGDRYSYLNKICYCPFTLPYKSSLDYIRLGKDLIADGAVALQSYLYNDLISHKAIQTFAIPVSELKNRLRYSLDFYNDIDNLDFRLFEPVCKWKLYLPLFGEININPLEKVSDNDSIIINYYADPYSGVIRVDILSAIGDDYNLMYTDEKNFTIELPVAFGQGAEYFKIATSLMKDVSLAATAVVAPPTSVGVTSTTSVMKKDPIFSTEENYSKSRVRNENTGRMVTASDSSSKQNTSSRGGTETTKTDSKRIIEYNDASRAINGLLNNRSITTSPHKISGGSYVENLLSCTEPYFILEIADGYYPDGYSLLFGRISHKTTYIKYLTGFFNMANLHIQGIPATTTELNEIQDILISGVIKNSQSGYVPPEPPPPKPEPEPAPEPEPIEPIEPETKWLSPWSGKFKVTSTYGEKRTYTATDGKVYRDIHSGLDMVGIGDISVYSIAEGTVEYIGWQDSSDSLVGFGYYCRINTNGKLFYYAHMRANSSKLKVGDKVSKGTKIGVMGSTGRVDGAHLHLEVRANTSPSSHENICSYTLLPNKIGTYE